MADEKVKKIIFKKWWFWLIIVVVIIAIANSGDDKPQKVSENPTPTPTANEESETVTPAPETPTPVPEPEIFKIGDAVESGDYIFTLNSVREDEGSEFFKPKDGNIYYIVDMTVENKSDKSVTVSSMLMFNLIDGDSYSYSITFGADTKGQLDGEIGAGRKLRGELTFEIPKDATGLEIEVDPSLWALGTIIFKLDK